MRRIFLPDHQISDNIIIAGEKAVYLSVVLRTVPGDTLFIHDNAGNVFRTTVLSSSRKEVSAHVEERLPTIQESPVMIRLYQGMLKGEKMDLVVQKAVELGVHEIVPVVTGRSQVRETRKLARWRKIAEEAARQSGRPVIPVVQDVIGYGGIFNNDNAEAVRGIIFWEGGGDPLQRVVSGLHGLRKIDLITGPEGGFSETEVRIAHGSGFVTASLGSRILRAETASIAVVSIVQFALGDLGAV